MKSLFPIAALAALLSVSTAGPIEDLISKYRSQGNNVTDMGAMPNGQLGTVTNRISDIEIENEPIALKESVLDGAINDSSYILGPNDHLQAFIWGTTNASIRFAIDVEGNVLIPSVGIMKVGGMSLASAKDTLKTLLHSKFRVNEISISLIGIRTFKVYVTGDVKKPNSYNATATGRACDLILQAGIAGENARTRGIHLLRKDGDTLLVDLVSYLQGGSNEYNPLLLEGDRIHVGRKGEYISVRGAVQAADQFDYQPGDGLGDAIRIAGGFSRDVDSNHITLFRFANNRDSLDTISLAYPRDRDFRLFPDDRVFVFMKSKFRIHRQVTIEGEVTFPGTYPIRKDKTTLLELFGMAGGLTEDAFLGEAKITREGFQKSIDLEYERIRSMPMEFLDDLEKSYLKAKMTDEEGNVSADLENLFGKTGHDGSVILRDNDRIQIPRRNLSVKVMGQVMKPGLVTHKPGQDMEFYIRQAGGMSSYAWTSKVRVIKAGSGIWRTPGEVGDLEPGDTVWVPERIRKEWWRMTKDAIMFTSNVVLLIVNVLLLNEKL